MSEAILPLLTAKAIIRFWSKVNIPDDAGPDDDRCWEWSLWKDKDGYGQFTIRKAIFGAHRVAYVIANRVDLGTMCVCHKCDVPSCVNPRHLFLGTHTDNMRDRTEKGRTASGRGDANGNAKLTESDVPRIFAMSASGMTQREIAKIFGVSQSLICFVLRHKLWNHVDVSFIG